MMNRKLWTPANSREPSRRQFLQRSGTIAAASALAGVSIPHVHAAENNTIRLALIGCGGRGSGAVGNAMNSIHGPVKLYAMRGPTDLLGILRAPAALDSLSVRPDDKVRYPCQPANHRSILVEDAPAVRVQRTHRTTVCLPVRIILFG